jgi:hypothetical protein
LCFQKKWSKLVNENNSGDEEDDESCGLDEEEAEYWAQKQDKFDSAEDLRRERAETVTALAASMAKGSQASKASKAAGGDQGEKEDAFDTLILNGGIGWVQKRAVEGGEAPLRSPLFLWSQTQSEIVVRVVVPPLSKAQQVSVSLTPVEADGASDRLRKCKLEVRRTASDSGLPDSPDYVCGSVLANPVWLASDPHSVLEHSASGMDVKEWEDKVSLDWTLEDLPKGWAASCYGAYLKQLQGRKGSEGELEGYLGQLQSNKPTGAGSRCVKIVLQKKPPVERVVQWWSRLFAKGGTVQDGALEENEVDLKAIRERNRPAVQGRQGFEVQNAWNQAEEDFKKKVPALAANRQKVGELLSGAGAAAEGE